MSGRVILHVDLDAFYASVEEREDPSLQGKPVVVCMFSARGGDSGAVATPNYIARKDGVRSGMSIARAKKLSPEAVYLPARRDFYSEVSEKVMEILQGYADSFEQVSIDEAFIDVSYKTKGDFVKGEEYARKIKKEIKGKERLTCSIGVGPNKLIAKVASSYDKPDGLTVVSPEAVVEFLSPLEVERLWGVGTKTKEGLEDIGVKTIGELSEVEMSRLIELFGKSRGQWLYKASRGVDDELVVERGEREQIGRIMTLEKDTRDYEFIYERVKDLAREVHSRVLERGVMFRTVSVSFVTSDMKGYTRSRSLSAHVQDFEAILNIAGDLISAFLMETDALIRRAGVRVSNLSKEDSRQRSLLSF